MRKSEYHERPGRVRIKNRCIPASPPCDSTFVLALVPDYTAFLHVVMAIDADLEWPVWRGLCRRAQQEIGEYRAEHVGTYQYTVLMRFSCESVVGSKVF